MSEILSEKDMGTHNNATTGFKALAKKAGGGEKGAKIAGAQFQKMKKAGQLEEQGVAEMRGRRDAYQRDYDSSRTGFGRPPREDDEYVNGDDDEVNMQSQHTDVPHDVHINGKKWKSFGSHSHASNVAKKIKGATVHKSIGESATAGATSSANVSVGAVYKNKPTKQAKNKDGTAKNALDMKTNLLTGGSVKR